MLEKGHPLPSAEIKLIRTEADTAFAARNFDESLEKFRLLHKHHINDDSQDTYLAKKVISGITRCHFMLLHYSDCIATAGELISTDLPGMEEGKKEEIRTDGLFYRALALFLTGQKQRALDDFMSLNLNDGFNRLRSDWFEDCRHGAQLENFQTVVCTHFLKNTFSCAYLFCYFLIVDGFRKGVDERRGVLPEEERTRMESEADQMQLAGNFAGAQEIYMLIYRNLDRLSDFYTFHTVAVKSILAKAAHCQFELGDYMACINSCSNIIHAYLPDADYNQLRKLRSDMYMMRAQAYLATQKVNLAKIDFDHAIGIARERQNSFHLMQRISNTAAYQSAKQDHDNVMETIQRNQPRLDLLAFPIGKDVVVHGLQNGIITVNNQDVNLNGYRGRTIEHVGDRAVIEFPGPNGTPSFQRRLKAANLRKSIEVQARRPNTNQGPRQNTNQGPRQNTNQGPRQNTNQGPRQNEDQAHRQNEDQAHRHNQNLENVRSFIEKLLSNGQLPSRREGYKTIHPDRIVNIQNELPAETFALINQLSRFFTASGMIEKAREFAKNVFIVTSSHPYIELTNAAKRGEVDINQYFSVDSEEGKAKPPPQEDVPNMPAELRRLPELLKDLILREVCGHHLKSAVQEFIVKVIADAEREAQRLDPETQDKGQEWFKHYGFTPSTTMYRGSFDESKMGQLLGKLHSDEIITPVKVMWDLQPLDSEPQHSSEAHHEEPAATSSCFAGACRPPRDHSPDQPLATQTTQPQKKKASREIRERYRRHKTALQQHYEQVHRANEEYLNCKTSLRREQLKQKLEKLKEAAEMTKFALEFGYRSKYYGLEK